MAKEIELLQAAMDGHTAAFEQIVKKYQSLVCAITFSGTGRVDISEELAQETFLSAWKNLCQLTDLNGFRPWLCAIARNMLCSYYRKKKTVPLDPADIAELSDHNPSPSDHLILQEEHAMLEKALMHIPVDYREPLVMYYRQGKSTREVAVGLGLNESTVRTRLHRARQMLQEAIAQRVEETLEKSGPGQSFTKAVMVAVGGTLVGMSASASAASAAGGNAAGASASSTMTTLMGTVTAKIAAAAAVVMIAIGAVFVYEHFAGHEQQAATSGVHAVDVVEAVAEPIVTVESSDAVLPAVQELAPEPLEIKVQAVTVAEHPAEAETVQVEPVSLPQNIEIPESSEYVFEPNGILSGLITDEDTGEPVVGAEIVVYNVSVPGGRLVTDENGFYSLDTIGNSGFYKFGIQSMDYVGRPNIDDDHMISIKTDQQQVANFRLKKACMADLWIKDEQGNPIKGAEVDIVDLARNRSTAVSRCEMIKPSDKEGYTLVGGLSGLEGGYKVMITHKGRTGRLISTSEGHSYYETKYDFAPSHIILENTDPNIVSVFDVTMKKGRQVQGDIAYSDGVPACDLKIVAEPSWWAETNISGEKTDIAPDGSFTLSHITPEKYSISAYYPVSGVYKPVETIDFSQHDGGLHFILADPSPESLLTIKGVVKVIKKAPVGNLYINIYSYNTSTDTHGSGTAVWYNDGSDEAEFEINRLKPGNYRLTFQSEHFEPLVLDDIQPPVDDLYIEMVQVVKPEIPVEVIDKVTGKPVTHMKARLVKTASRRGNTYGVTQEWRERSNPEGKTVFTVTPGVYRVQVMAEGYSLGTSAEIDTDMPETVVVELTPGGSISGSVVDEAGEAIDGATVMVLSYCGGNSGTSMGQFISQERAVVTEKGRFIIPHVPAGVETLKVTHPDYAFKVIENIEVAEGQVTGDVQVVLSQGATVEGYVYDGEGKPEEGVVLFFQDPFAYGGSDNEEASRYGAAETDKDGFYRLSRLPEKMCLVQRKDKWNSLGVILRTVVPKNGQVTKLDFGGEQVLTGRAVIDGAALSEVKVQLGSVESPYFGNYCAKARTDLEGNFIFRGVIEGEYALYYEIPEKRNDWVKLSNVEIGREDLDVGIIPGDLSELVVTIDQGGGDKVISQMFLSDAEKVFGQPLYHSTRKNEESGQWFFRGIEAGDYLLTIVMSDDMQVRQLISLSSFEKDWSVPVELPTSTSGIFGTMKGDASEGIVLWKDDISLLHAIRPDGEGSYKVDHLPAGKYVIGSAMNLLNGSRGMLEFELGVDERLQLNVDLSAKKPDEMGFLQAQVLDDQGKPRLDVDIQLVKDGKHIKPLQSTQIGHIFITTPGDYLLTVEAEGFKTVEQDITLKPVVMGAAKPKITLINLEKE